MFEFLQDLYSAAFKETAAEMGYHAVADWLNVDIETAIINQMKRDKKPPFPWEQPKREYAAPEDLQDECTFNGEVFLQPAVQYATTKEEVEALSKKLLAEHDRKDVAGKLDPLLIPLEAVNAYATVSDYGQQKYGNRDSWQHSSTGVETYTAAAGRHLFKSRTAAEDEESAIPHLYHALWSVAAAIWHLENSK